MHVEDLQVDFFKKTKETDYKIEDLQREIDELKSDINELKSDIEQHKKSLEFTDERIDRIVGALDDFRFAATERLNETVDRIHSQDRSIFILWVGVIGLTVNAIFF